MSRYYKVDIRGKAWMQRSTIPGYDPTDEGRLLYDTVTKKLFYADDAAFNEIASLDDAIAEVTFENLDGNGDVGTGATQVAQGNHTHASLDYVVGFANRTKFVYNSTTSIILWGSRYHHNGTVDQVVGWDSNITFTFGPGGSNPASSALGVSQWQYIYIDDSALVGSTVTASSLLNSTTAPVWSATKLGYYGTGAGGTQTTDRCIGAFYINSSGNVDRFTHDGNDEISWDAQYTAFTGNPGTGFSTTVTLRLPTFSTKAGVTFFCYAAGNTSEIACYYRQSGGATSVGHIVGEFRGKKSGDNDDWLTVNQVEVHTSTSQQIDLRASSNDGDTRQNTYQNSYFLPKGM